MSSPAETSGTFRGSLVALVTPFRAGAVDAEALKALVDWHVEQGSHGLVPCGTTGESPTLNHEEHRQVVETCVAAAAGRVPVIAGTGSNSTAEAVAFTRHAADAGADGALVIAPYYNKPTQDGLFAHYKALDDCVEDFPLLVYNVPGRTAVDVSVATMTRLAGLKNIAGVKDATGDLARVSRMRVAAGEEFRQICGDDATALGFAAHGGHGCISVTANVAPAACAAMQSACMAGDFARARQIHDALMPLHEALFMETSPAPVKFAASLLNLCAPEVRLPLVSVGEATRACIRKAMVRASLLEE